MKVEFTKKAQKQLLKAPKHCQIKALDWINQIESEGLVKVRQLKGYHDEPLKGEKEGRRSIRLNIKWRLEYEENETNVLITVVEVHAHNY